MRVLERKYHSESCVNDAPLVCFVGYGGSEVFLQVSECIHAKKLRELHLQRHPLQSQVWWMAWVVSVPESRGMIEGSKWSTWAIGMSFETRSGVVKMASIFNLSPSASWKSSSTPNSTTPREESIFLLSLVVTTAIRFLVPFGNGN